MTDNVKDLIAEAKKRFERAQEADSENRDRARQAIKFRALQQWLEPLKAIREDQNQKGGPRPCLVLDKTNQYINQVKNDQRQNRSSVKVRPVDDNADPDVAEVLNGLIRHIEDNSHADLAYDTAFEAALDGGFGYWRIITDYSDDLSFDQEILIKRVRNRFTVLLDPDHQEPDGSDSRFAFVYEDMDRKDFKREYPNAKPMDFGDSGPDSWNSEEKVRIVEYFRIVPETTQIHLLDDGTVLTDEDLKAAQEQGVQVNIAASRETTINKVKWSKLTEEEELDAKDWPGKYIPIVEVVGNEIDIEGKRRLSGMLDESTQDSQRMHNYAMSAFVESVALAPRAPWVAAAGQIENFEDEWAQANRSNVSVLQYNPVDLNGSLLPPPQRQSPPGIPTGWQALLQNTEHGLQASLGMYQANVGAPSNEKSGRAILARQKEGDTGSFHYFDNLARSIRHTGRILIDLIPKIYDTKRVVRIIGEDGTPDSAELDPEQQQAKADKTDALGRVIGQIYNPSIGKYDVTVSTGPAYSTKRQEAADFMGQMVQGKPELFQIIGDLMFKNMDMPGAEEIAERLKKMLPPQLQEDGGQNPEVQQLHQQIQQMAQQFHGQLQQMQAQLQDKHEDRELTRYKAEIDAATKISVAEINSKVGDLQTQLDWLQTLMAQVLQPEPTEPNEQQEQDPNPPSAGFLMPTGGIPPG